MDFFRRVRFRGLCLIISCLLLAGPLSAAEVSLAWDVAPGSDRLGHGVFYGASPKNYTNVVWVRNVDRAVVGGLEEGKHYYFSVVSYNIAGLSEYSNEVDFEVPLTRIDVVDDPGNPPGGPDLEDQSFVLAYWAGRVRNDFNGAIGMRFTTGKRPIDITQIGRLKVSGNYALHLLELFDADSGNAVPGGWGLVDMSQGNAGEIQYATLSVPVTLKPYSSYYLVTSETAGGDSWLNVDTVIQRSDLVRDVTGVVRIEGAGWINVGTQDHSFGLVNFKYKHPDSPGASPIPEIPAPTLKVRKAGEIVSVTIEGQPGTPVKLEITEDFNYWWQPETLYLEDEPFVIPLQLTEGEPGRYFRIADPE